MLAANGGKLDILEGFRCRVAWDGTTKASQGRVLDPATATQGDALDGRDDVDDALDDSPPHEGTEQQEDEDADKQQLWVIVQVADNSWLAGAIQNTTVLHNGSETGFDVVEGSHCTNDRILRV